MLKTNAKVCDRFKHLNIRVRNLFRIWRRLHLETFEKRSILFKFKEGEKLALPLHFVQPQEYIEYFEDSADG